MNISKTDVRELISLIDRAVNIIKTKSPTTKEYNVARKLWLIKNKLIKRQENE